MKLHKQKKGKHGKPARKCGTQLNKKATSQKSDAKQTDSIIVKKKQLKVSKQLKALKHNAHNQQFKSFDERMSRGLNHKNNTNSNGKNSTTVPTVVIAPATFQLPTKPLSMPEVEGFHGFISALDEAMDSKSINIQQPINRKFIFSKESEKPTNTFAVLQSLDEDNDDIFSERVHTNENSVPFIKPATFQLPMPFIQPNELVVDNDDDL